MDAIGKEELVTLESIHSRITEKMPRAQYDLLKDFIIDALNHDGEITFSDLLMRAEKDLRFAGFKLNLNYHLLKVKQDLEAKRLIRIRRSIGSSRIQVISLVRTRLRATA